MADLRRTGATDENVDRVQLHTGPTGVFEALGVEFAMESATEEKVFLNDDLPGAHVVIQQTEALTAVDVNAGRAALIDDTDNEVELWVPRHLPQIWNLGFH